jgi:hypothetical protein
MRGIYFVIAFVGLISTAVVAEPANQQCKINKTGYFDEAFELASSGKAFAAALNSCSDITMQSIADHLTFLDHPNPDAPREQFEKIMEMVQEFSILRKEKIPGGLMIKIATCIEAKVVRSQSIDADRAWNMILAFIVLYDNYFDRDSLTVDSAKALSNSFAAFSSKLEPLEILGPGHAYYNVDTRNWTHVSDADCAKFTIRRNEIKNIASQRLIQAICERKDCALIKSTLQTNAIPQPSKN